MARGKRTTLPSVRGPAEIPPFGSERDEAAFWASHGLGDELLECMAPVERDILPPPRPRSRPIAVRFDEDVLRRLRVVAARKRKGYQTLLKEFVVERLSEEEQREGLVASR